MKEKLKEIWFAFWYICVYIPMFLFYEFFTTRGQEDMKVKDVVAWCKNNGKSIRFECNGYIVDIYEPGTNLDGPFEA